MKTIFEDERPNFQFLADLNLNLQLNLKRVKKH